MSRFRNQSAWSVLALVGPAVVLAGSYRVLVPSLGEARFGLFAIVTSLSGALAFLTLGLPLAMTRQVAASTTTAQQRAIARTGVLGFCLVGLAAIVVVLIIAPAIVPEGVPARTSVAVVRLGGLAVASQLIAASAIAIAKGLYQFRIVAVALTVSAAARFGGAAVVAVWTDGDVLAATWAFTLASMGAMVWVCWLTTRPLRGRARSHRPRYDGTVVRSMLGYSGPLFVAAAAGSLHLHGQLIVVGRTIDAQAVAAFSVAITGLSQVIGVARAATEPLMPRAASRSPGRLDAAALRCATRFSTLVSSALMAPLVVAPAWFLRLWLGDGVPEGAPALVTLVGLGIWANGTSHGAHFLLLGAGKPRYAAYAALTSLVALVVILAYTATLSPLTTLRFAQATAVSLALGSMTTLAGAVRESRRP